MMICHRIINLRLSNFFSGITSNNWVRKDMSMVLNCCNMVFRSCNFRVD